MKIQKEETINMALLAFGVGSKLGVGLLFSRAHKSEADELGLNFMAVAGSKTSRSSCPRRWSIITTCKI